MFWTNIVKGIGKVIVALGILVSVGLGLPIVANPERGGVLAGILVVILGIVITFIGASGMMMICEISQNIAETKKLLEQHNNNGNV